MYDGDDKNEEDVSYNTMVADAVMELMKTFSKQGHSGFSAGMVREIFDKLASFKTLSPITSDPEEWTNVATDGQKDLWQSKRDPAMFSHDGGKTWKSVDESVMDSAKRILLSKAETMHIKLFEEFKHTTHENI
jgi:hypothetical protein